MEYAFIVIGGVVIGFMAPQTWRASFELSAGGLFFLVATMVAATLFSYNAEGIISLLLLRDTKTLFELGFFQLTLIAYTCFVASIAVGVRMLLLNKRD